MSSRKGCCWDCMIAGDYKIAEDYKIAGDMWIAGDYTIVGGIWIVELYFLIVNILAWDIQTSQKRYLSYQLNY